MDAAAHHGRSPRIVGGQEASPHAYPFVLSLREYSQHICGAALVSATWVVTAAHCITPSLWEPTSRYSVGVQRHDISLPAATDGECAEDIEIAEIKRHPAYNTETMVNDICLLRLSQIPRCASRMEMPVLDAGGSSTAGTLARVAGWGEVRPALLCTSNETPTDTASDP